MADENNYRKSVDSAGIETKLTPASDKDVDVIKGDASESGSNSFAKNVQAAVKGLKKDFNNYSKAKKRDKAKVKG